MQRFCLAVTTCLLTASAAQAAVVLQTAPGAWDDPATWGGSAVVPANTYRTISGSSITLNPGSSPTFPGGELWMAAQGRPLFSSDNSTISANIRLEAGVMNRNRNGAAALQGTLNVINTNDAVGVAQIGAGNNSNSRGWDVQSLITGDADSFLTFFSTDSVASAAINRDVNFISNPNNTFAGTIYTSGYVDLVSTVAGSLGTAKLVIRENGRFEAEYDITSGLNTLTTEVGATFDLDDQDHLFLAATVGATELAPGTYDANELNALAGGTFTGTGTFTVVPEPGALTLSAAGWLMLFRRR